MIHLEEQVYDQPQLHKNPVQSQLHEDHIQTVFGHLYGANVKPMHRDHEINLRRNIFEGNEVSS